MTEDATQPTESQQTALIQHPEPVVPESVPTASVLGEDIGVAYWDGAGERELELHVGVAKESTLVLSDADDRVSGTHYALSIDGPQRSEVYITDGSDGSVLGPVTGIETPWGRT